MLLDLRTKSVRLAAFAAGAYAAPPVFLGACVLSFRSHGVKEKSIFSVIAKQYFCISLFL